MVGKIPGSRRSPCEKLSADRLTFDKREWSDHVNLFMFGIFLGTKRKKWLWLPKIHQCLAQFSITAFRIISPFLTVPFLSRLVWFGNSLLNLHRQYLPLYKSCESRLLSVFFFYYVHLLVTNKAVSKMHFRTYKDPPKHLIISTFIHDSLSLSLQSTTFPVVRQDEQPPSLPSITKMKAQ